jgi:germination protein YpeB
MDTLEVSLSKIIVSASPGSNLTLLSDISRQANSMLSNLSSLPVSHPAFSDTIKFINQLGDFCSSLERSAGDGKPLSTDNMDTLIELHNVCAGLSRELGELQREGVAFTPLDPASYLDGSSVDEAFTGLGQDDLGVSYPTLIYDGPFSESLQQQTAQGLTGETVDEEGARLAAADFLGLDLASVRVTSASRSKIQGVMLEADAPGGLTYLTVTLQGGHIQWMMEESGAAQELVSADRCVDIACAKLEKLGYTDLAVTWTQQYDGILIINFAYCADGVVFYPDLVKARVRMDDGSLCGLDATAG